MDLERMQALLTALQEARFAGLRSVSYDGKTVAYGSDAELATAMRDLEGRIAAVSGPSARRRRWAPSRPRASDHAARCLPGAARIHHRWI